MCMGADSSKSDGGMTDAAKAMHRRSSPSTDDVDYVVGRGSNSSLPKGSTNAAPPSRTLLASASNTLKSKPLPKSDPRVLGNRQMVQPFKQRDGRKQRTNIFTGLGRIGKSLITRSPTYQFLKGLSETYKGN